MLIAVLAIAIAISIRPEREDFGQIRKRRLQLHPVDAGALPRNQVRQRFDFLSNQIQRRRYRI